MRKHTPEPDIPPSSSSPLPQQAQSPTPHQSLGYDDHHKNNDDKVHQDPSSTLEDVFDTLSPIEVSKNVQPLTPPPSSDVLQRSSTPLPLDDSYLNKWISRLEEIMEPSKDTDASDHSSSIPLGIPVVRYLDYDNRSSDAESFMAISASPEDNGCDGENIEGPALSAPAVSVAAGLVNFGHTCYMNAILQCFTHTVPLVQGLRSCGHVTPCESYSGLFYYRFCAICALRQHIEDCIAYTRGPFCPLAFSDNLSHFSPSFRGTDQSDAYELLLSVLNKLQESFIEGEENVIDKVFGGRLRSKLQCCSCSHFSISYEPIVHLSVEIEDVTTVERALKAFTMVKKIHKKFKCDGCLEEVTMEKQLTVNEAPQVLVVHLKRFQKIGEYFNKIEDHVYFTMDLDLEPYTSRNPNDNEILKYDLYAVVVHFGYTPNSGHYFCFIRSSPGKWHQFDDDQVSSVEGDDVLCQQAYILFYVKQGIPWFSSSIIKSIIKSDEEANVLMAVPINAYYENADKLHASRVEKVDVSIVQVQVQQPGVAGLANLGNTCFMNAILQCFTHTVPLVQGLRSSSHSIPCEDYISVDPARFCAVCVLGRHIETSIACSTRVFRPEWFADNLGNFSSSFRRYQQSDAHEFMLSLLNKLQSRFVGENVIDKVFGGRLLSKLQCCSCTHSSNSYEPMVDMSLEIEDAVTIENALKSFTRVEKIDEKLKCNGCLQEVSMEKQLMLNESPQVLILHLKRFKKVGDNVNKIDAHVHFTMNLDLEPYTLRNPNDNKTLKYDLYAVVVHLGSSPNSGHYYCFIRSAPDRWHKYNDEEVTSVLEDYVLSQQAYILFYVQEGIPWFFPSIIKSDEKPNFGGGNCDDHPMGENNKKDGTYTFGKKRIVMLTPD